MKLDPNFQYYNGRSGGRTTKMLLDAIELAKEPQTIVVVAHSANYARDLVIKTISILDEQAPELGHLSYVPIRDMTTLRNRGLDGIEFPAVGSRILFRTIYAKVGQGLFQSLVGVSILFDHHALELNTGTGAYGTAYRYWQEVVEAIQAANSTKEVQ